MGMPLLMLTTDITDTHMLMDMAVTMVDTTDTPTVTSTRDLLMLNLKLKPNPKLMPPPGTDTTVDTTVIPTDMDMLVPTDTMAVTGGKLFTMNSHFIKLANFYPPFKLSRYHQLLPLKH